MAKDTKIEFVDFKKSITTKEFQAILDIAKEEYRRLEEVITGSVRFNDRLNEGVEKINDINQQMPPGLAEKLTEGFRRKAKEQAKEMFKNEISRNIQVTDFLNRFQTSDELLPYLTF